MKPLTKRQMELLTLLGRGPRYGFTDFRLVNALVERKLAKKSGDDVKITAAGRRLLPTPPRYDQSNSQNCPGFVEAFRVHR